MNKVEYTKKFKKVHMNEICITSKEFPIIGTDSLGPCVAFLVYCEEKKCAILAHIPDNSKDYFSILLDVIALYDLSKYRLKYTIIKGYYDNGYKVDDILEKKFKMYSNIFVPFTELPLDAVKIDENATSHEFAFDSRIGEFVTEKVFFGYEYIKIHEKNNLKI